MGNIVKNQEMSLSSISPDTKKILMGFSWDAPAESEGKPLDIDASAFLLGGDGRVRLDTDFVFYNNVETEGGSVKHLGDCKTPEGKGDNERIQIQLDKLSFDVIKITFSLTIHNSHERFQDLGLIKSGFLRLIDIDKNQEIIRFDLVDHPISFDSLVYGELERDVSGGWTFRAVSEPKKGGLFAIASDFGVNVAPN